MSHHQSVQRKRNRNKHITHWGMLMLWALLLNMPRCLSAQTVYRCGEHYSASAQCPHSTTPSVQDTRNTEQAKAQERVTQQNLRDAQALEKSRVQTERQAPSNRTHAAPTWTPDNTHASTAHENLAAPSRHAHHPKASPYFTAKDGSGKSDQKAKPSTQGKATSDAAAKP